MDLEFQSILKAAEWLAPILIVDFLFTGISLRLLGFGSWYTGLMEGEELLYRGRSGGRKGGWTWGGVVIVTNRRFLVRYHFSPAALVDIPFEAIREVSPDRWWWFHTVRVVYQTRGRERCITVDASRKVQQDLLRAFGAVGVKVTTSGSLA